MTGEFDDIIKNKLDGLESAVPADMFKEIQTRMTDTEDAFDKTIREKMLEHPSPVPTDMWSRIQTDAFDENMREKLLQHPSPVPADMWNKIQKEKDRKKPVAWWWAAAFLLLLGAGTVYFLRAYHQSSVDQRPVPDNIAGNERKPANNNAAVTVSPNTNDSDQNTTASNTALPGPNDSDQNTTASNTHEPAKNSKSFNSNKPTVDLLSRQKAGENDAALIKAHPSQNAGFSVKQNPGNTAFGTSDRRKTFKNARTVIQSGAKGSLIVKDKNIPLSDQGGDAREADAAATYPADQEAINANERQLRTRQMIGASFRAKARLLPGHPEEAHIKEPILPCPVNGDENRNDWYVDLYASPVLVFKSLSANAGGKSTINAMDSTLHRQVSFNAGINIVKNLGEHFLVKTGVLYNQVNEVFRNTRINEIKLITTVTIRTVILSPGDTLFIRDTSVIRQIGTVTKQTQNHYQSWDIPLIFGYEFGGKDLRLNANLGLIANLHSSYQGEMLDTLQQTVNIANHKNTGVYKTNLGLGVYAGVAILKSIGTRTDLLIEPHARFNLSNMTNDPFWFRQKNIQAGLSVGIRYKLNGSRQRP